MKAIQFRMAFVGAVVALSLSGCTVDAPTEGKANPTPTTTAESPTPTLDAKPAAVLPDVPIVATVTATATDSATGAVLDMTLVAHEPQDLGTPAADQILDVLTEAGDTSFLSVPQWLTDNRVKLMILDLAAVPVGDVAWPAQALVRVELGPWVEKQARAPLGVEWTSLDGRFGYSDFVSGAMDGHVIAAFMYDQVEGYPLGPWYDYQSSLGFGKAVNGASETSITNCEYVPTALAAPWQANPNWYQYEDFGHNEVCGAGFGGE